MPGYAFAVLSAYYCINQFTPVAAWIYLDLKKDMHHGDAGRDEERREAD